MIKIFLADDHVMVREGLASLVAGDPGIETVGQCSNGLEVIPGVEESNPDIVVLDIAMPGLNGLDTCRELTRKFKDISVLILTIHNDDDFVARALENGAAGFLLKESAADQLVEAIYGVAEGATYLGPGISKNAIQRIARGERDSYEQLSNRERQVLQLIAEGKTNRQIAEELKLSVKTIDAHRTRLMRKLDIHDQTALVKYAIRKGIITIGPGIEFDYGLDSS